MSTQVQIGQQILSVHEREGRIEWRLNGVVIEEAEAARLIASLSLQKAT
jgi:hypothetical protein